MSSLLDKIRMAEKKALAPDKHYYPFAYWKNRWKKGETQTKRWLEIGEKSGLLRKKICPVSRDGHTHMAPHWAEIEKLEKEKAKK